jgi:hypothetical protein
MTDDVGLSKLVVYALVTGRFLMTTISNPEMPAIQADIISLFEFISD